MVMPYASFYKKYGVRRIEQIANPIMTEMKYLELPFSSIYHYTSYDGVANGPPSDDYLFRNIKKPIMVSHVLELTDNKGMPRKQVINTNGIIRDYHNLNRRTRILRDISFADRDMQALIVCNYCLLDKSYRYIRSFYTEYYKWNNDFATTLSTIAKIAETSDRQHYFIAKTPKVIPSLGQLSLATESLSLESWQQKSVAQEEMTQNLLKVFRDKESYLLLELWKWLGDNRQDSLFSRIPENKIHLVNIVFEETGKWTVVNIGQLNAFRKVGPGGTTAQILSKLMLEPIQLQKRLLRMFMTIMEIRTVTANTQNNQGVGELEQSSDEIDTVEDIAIDDDEFDDDQEDSANEVKEVVVDTPVDIEPEESTVSIPQELQVDASQEETDEEVAAKILLEDEQLDQDLSALNEIAKLQEESSQDSEASLHEAIYEDKNNSLESGITSMCERLADEGMLSAVEYKKFLKLASVYKTIPSPDGTTTLDKFIVVPPEVLKITTSSVVPDSATVLDKSMLKSSLLTFDDKYISEVLNKDTTAMVLNIQKAGIAVTGYKVDEVVDILGSYQMHRVKLTPVVGKPSTLVFKIPIIEKDGSFSSGGTLYFLRKQRGDLPIRKIDSNKVALTSYYGKVFINRGKKKADDYGHWLQAKVMEKVLNKQDLDLQGVNVTNVFDQSLVCPRAYSALAMTVKSFTCKGYHFLLDHKEKLSTYSPQAIAQFEVNGSMILARNTEGNYLVIDDNNTLYTTEKDQLVPFGSLESFLNIDAHNTPLEFASVGVFGKDVPIGVILGLQIGFERLLRLLKAQPRRVAAGARVHLAMHEYALVFSDETLVFNRDNRFASMVLGGFNEYAKSLKLFSVYSFDKRGVYVNLLEASGLGTRYIREIDLMYKMFIDPITRDLLIEMKEPTTFQGLLLRSCEMLLNDQHPDELDPAFMRIKGYERLAGAVYSELVQSLRVYNSKMSKSNSSIEMNPYSVWKRISEDPAKAQVNQINPIHSLKEVEAVTTGGTGGRNRRSMTKSTRAFHPNDMGTISESTVDSSDVAINVFTSADPQFTSLRGMSKRFDMDKPSAASLISTTALMSVGLMRDD